MLFFWTLYLSKYLNENKNKSVSTKQLSSKTTVFNIYHKKICLYWRLE